MRGTPWLFMAEGNLNRRRFGAMLNAKSSPGSSREVGEVLNKRLFQIRFGVFIFEVEELTFLEGPANRLGHVRLLRRHSLRMLPNLE